MDMKSPDWHSEDAPVSKFRILGCKIEDGVGAVSMDLFKTEPNASRLNIILLVSLSSVVHRFILVNIAMISLCKIIIGIS